MTNKIAFKNLILLQNKLIKVIFPPTLIAALLLLLLGKASISISMLLGCVFSYFALSNMMLAQSDIIRTKKRAAFFIPMILRLFIYAIPLTISLIFKDYLNLWVTLIFLWSFQIGFIILELKRSIKKTHKKV